jgi:hypothetical protein
MRFQVLFLYLMDEPPEIREICGSDTQSLREVEVGQQQGR